MAIPYLGMAAISGGLGLFGNIFGARSAASAAQAQVDASADQLEKNVMLNREGRKANLAKFIGQNVADYGYGADLDFQRQKDASIFDSTRKRDLERGANIKDYRAMLGEQMSPLAIQQRQRARRGRILEETARRRAQTEGMFGPISSSYG